MVETEERIRYEQLPNEKIGNATIVRTAQLQRWGYELFIEQFKDYVELNEVEVQDDICA